MKHQVLGRVFSVVLAILCLILLATGVRGYDKAEMELGERRAYEEKFEGRIRNYVELEAELDGSISYEQAREELDKLVEQHEADASQHRTDTALHTAEKGGNIMGADAIWEMLPEVKGAKQELEEGKQELGQKEKIYAKAKPGIEKMVNNGVAACRDEKASIAELAAELRSLGAKPTMPEEPQMPAAPLLYAKPVEPVREAFVTMEPPEGPPEGPPEQPAERPTEDMDPEELAAYQAELDAYQAELAAYNAALTAYNTDQAAYEAQVAAYETAAAAYEANLAAYEQNEYEKKNEEKMKAYNDALNEYEDALAAYPAACAAAQEEIQSWNTEYSRIASQISAELEAVGALANDLTAAGNELAALASALGADAGSAGGLGTGGGGLSVDQFASMTPEMIIAALPGAVDAISGGYGQISAGLAAIGNGLTQARNLLAAAEEEVKKAEFELNKQLQMIWLNLGELEKEAEELAAEKEELDEEASILSKKLLENEELKELTNRRNSARQLLLNVPEVKAASAESGDLPGAAEQYLETYRARTRELDEGMRRVNLLSILAAAAGILGIPGAFELIKKRFFLFVPILLCLGFAAGADWLQLSLGQGQHYAALFTAIFAALQFLIVLPKRKTPV